MERSESIIEFLESLKKDQPSFKKVDFSDINARNQEGENALHIAIIRNEFRIAKKLIESGIDVNARGDLGHTPLHEACAMTDLKFASLLVENGADLFALTEGVTPFTLARNAGKDDICDYLGEKMAESQSKNDSVWIKARIDYLEREVERLKQLL